MEAELVAYGWETVTLRSKSGRNVELRIDQLEETDQTYLKTVVPVVVIPGDGPLAGGILGDGLKHYSNEGFPPIEHINPAGEAGPQGAPIHLDLKARGEAIEERQ